MVQIKVKVTNFTNALLKNNNIEMYSTHNEGESAVAERFIRTKT